MAARDVRTTKEKRLFNIAFGISALAWITLVVSIIGIVYGILIGLFLYIAHSMMIAYIRGHALRLSADQFPGIYARVEDAARKLGLSITPEVYIMQAGGALNAFATKLTGRNFVVIYSDLLEACGDEGKELDMIIGHEIGHLALGHLKWLWFLMPARVVPLLGAAYSRACEYSSDLCGFVVTGDLQSSARGLAVLAAGGRYGKAANMNCYVDQADESGGFWSSVYELNSSHPYLPKRIAALMNYQSPGSVRIPSRIVLAYPLAPLLGVATPGGSAPLVMVAMVGMIAAIAIPQFAKYRQKADQAALDSAAIEIQAAAHSYFEKTGSWPCSDAELNAPNAKQLISQRHWKIETSCGDKAAFVTYQENGKDSFRRISFVDGEGGGSRK